MAIILAPFLIINYCQTILQNRNNFLFVDFWFLAFLTYFVLVVGFNLLIGTDIAIAKTLLAVTPQFLVLFIVVKLVNPQIPRFRNWVTLLYVLLTLLIFLNIQDGQFVVATADARLTEDRLADYQSYAFVYLVISIYIVTGLRSRTKRFAIYTSALAALFLNGARSEFVGFFMCIPIIELCLSKYKSVFLILGIAAITTSIILLPIILELLPENRVLMILKEYKQDDSVIERQNMAQLAWDTISSYPIFGSFASYKPGEYAHNIISVWVDLGLLGFTIFVLLIVIPVADMMLRFGKQSNNSDFILAFCLLLLVVLLTTMAKHFTYQLLPVALAAYARVVIGQRLM